MDRLNLGCGKHPLDGFINVDHVNSPGVNRVMDIFAYPWDFPDNSMDEFQASHIIEHIPHEPKFNDSGLLTLDEKIVRGRRWDELKDLDGFFCFFAEIWRIATPGAKVNIVTPFGYSRGAFQDPTHTRYIVPATFAYLTEETRNGPDFDYNLPLLFAIKKVQMEWANPKELGMDEASYEFATGHFWDMARNMSIELEIVK